MGERKGQNFYYPPDFDYKKHKSLNSYHGTHALRERAAKIKQGILIIRFEMPFNIWCLGCNNHIGMGVRYNAEKKKIGMYYTTPLYEFRMKCHLCDNYFVIRTDPEHFDYELVEGCRRQEKRYDPSTIDYFGPIDRGFSRQLESDRMFQIEHVEQDKAKATSSADQLGKLEYIQERMRDDFAANQFLRRSFRHEKTELKEQRAKDEDLLKRTSLNIKLLQESAEDKKLAAAVLRYNNMKSAEDDFDAKRSAALERPIFSSSAPSPSVKQSFSPKKILSMKLHRGSNAFDRASTSAEDSRITAGTLGVVTKRVKQECKDPCQEDDPASRLKTEDFEDVKPDITKLSFPEEQKLAYTKGISEEHVKNIKSEKTRSSLVADYGGGSSSDSSN